jgi:predicted permease
LVSGNVSDSRSENHGTLEKFWGPIIGPLVAIISFVCSIGNVPLAAVLWNGGISFGGVLAFIFADLIVLPILDIYRKYYGWRMAGFLLASFYVTMVAAGLIVEFVFVRPEGLTLEMIIRIGGMPTGARAPRVVDRPSASVPAGTASATPSTARGHGAPTARH